jgi:hypothetical protein
MLPKDFVLFVEAYNERFVKSVEVLRMHSFRTAQFPKAVSYPEYCRSYWPLPSDKIQDKGRIERLKERLKRSKENG